MKYIIPGFFSRSAPTESLISILRGFCLNFHIGKDIRRTWVSGVQDHGAMTMSFQIRNISDTADSVSVVSRTHSAVGETESQLSRKTCHQRCLTHQNLVTNQQCLRWYHWCCIGDVLDTVYKIRQLWFKPQIVTDQLNFQGTIFGEKNVENERIVRYHAKGPWN